jgi:hypothetical protein
MKVIEELNKSMDIVRLDTARNLYKQLEWNIKRKTRAELRFNIRGKLSNIIKPLREALEEN